MRRVLSLLPLLAACGSTGEVDKYQRTPEQEEKYKEAVARGDVKLGMKMAEVREAMGRKPNRTSKTTYARKPATCWYYDRIDFYFDEDGYCIGWQGMTG